MQEIQKINKRYVYNGSFFIKKFLYIGIVLILLFLLQYTYSKDINLKKAPINSIFYQPLLSDKMNWDDNFKKLQQANIETIFLQWSKFGVVDFIKDDTWLRQILSSAQKYKIKVVVGLYGDDKYFKTLENRKTNIEDYLAKLLKKNILQAKKIYMIAKNYNSFKGYYIYDEIDDTNFIEKSRQKQLKVYLQTMANSINQISKHSLYISAYFSKHMSPDSFVQMFSEITQKKYTLLIQSGIGAQLVDFNESSLYMKTFSKNFKGEFIPIIEGFKVKETKIKAIDLPSLQRQINIVKASTNTTNLSLFSLRYFLNDGLFSQYCSEYSTNNKH